MAFKPPRTIFLDFPIGCPAGKPNDPNLQREILRAALLSATQFGEPWKMVELPFQWSADGSRDWEEAVKKIYRQGLGIVATHVADHRAGESSSSARRENSQSVVIVSPDPKKQSRHFWC
ncbi:MAG: hypothetical protein O6837_06875 [Deltaproteobacteria bacterium]|nr:hypothetical protein [Deltaproteobacteria bacterium]